MTLQPCSGTCLVAQSCPTLCDPMDCSSLPSSSVHGDSPGKNSEVGCHFLLQGIFPTQGLKPGLLHCRQILSCLSHQGNLRCLVETIFKNHLDLIFLLWYNLNYFMIYLLFQGLFRFSIAFLVNCGKLVF